MEKLSPLRLRLKQALEWLKANMGMQQKDIAQRMGIAEASFSRGLKRCGDKYDSDFVIKFHQATGEKFNLDWLLQGTGQMLESDSNKNEQKQSAPVIDASSATNAAIAAYVELTNRLKQEMAERLEDKEAIIREKDARIIALERTIADRDARIIALERQIAAYHADDLSNYPFSVGVADKLVPQNNKKI